VRNIANRILNHVHRHGILTTLHNDIQDILYAVTNETVQQHNCDVSHSTPMSENYMVELNYATKTSDEAITVHGAIVLVLYESCSDRQTYRESGLNFQFDTHTHTHTHTHTRY